MKKFDEVEIGEALPEFACPPVTRLQLALFAGASGDHNPIHVDEDAAKASGLPGAIIHGMLSMAILGQMLTSWIPQRNLRSFATRFAAMNYPGDAITCRGKVVGKCREGGENLVDLELEAWNSRGEKTLAGSARVMLA